MRESKDRSDLSGLVGLFKNFAFILSEMGSKQGLPEMN
jgi:hypothetical protein